MYFSVILVLFRINGENVNQGRVGLAVVQPNAVVGHLRIILYRSKSDILSAVSLTSDDAVTAVRSSGDYVQFRDNDQQFWSVCFDSTADRSDFLRVIGVVKVPQSDGKAAVPFKPDVNHKPNPTISTPTITAVVPPSSAKTSLVNRMAKMGQHLPQMIHPLKPVVDDPSSSSSDSDAQSPSADSQMPNTAHTTMAKWKPTVVGRPSAFPTPVLATNNTLIQYNPPPTVTTPSGSSVAALHLDAAALPAHFSEMRMQNTEIRMNLSKLESRIERVLDKIDALPTTSSVQSKSERTDVEGEIIALEERIVTLRKENRELRLRQNSLDVTNSDLEDERTKYALLMEVNAAKDKDISDVRSELLTAQNRITELQAVIDDQAQSTRYNIEEISNLKAELQIKQDQLNNERLHRENESESREAIPKPTVDIVKQVLSEFYEHFHTTIDGVADLTAEQVLKIARTIIKREAQHATLNIPK